MISRFYCPEPLQVGELHPLLAFKFMKEERWRGVFDEDLPPNFFENEAHFVERPEDADAIILPNNFRVADAAAQAYIAAHADTAERFRIPLFVLSFGDLNDELRFDPRAQVFRLSAYRTTKKENDIMVPTTINDFAKQGIRIRPKTTVPLISFCGFAGLKSLRQWAAYIIKNVVWELRALREPVVRAHKRGIYWRRVAMRALKSSSLVQTNFIIRRSFSGALRTIELPPAQARKEYIESIQNTDFVLAPKGDGNYSNRFIETLSMGRIPVVVDTDIVLPLEDVIDYAKIMVRVPMNRVWDTPTYIREFYDALSEEEWTARQHLARKIFEEYLGQNVFFRYFFSHASN